MVLYHFWDSLGAPTEHTHLACSVGMHYLEVLWIRCQVWHRVIKLIWWASWAYDRTLGFMMTTCCSPLITFMLTRPSDSSPVSIISHLPCFCSASVWTLKFLEVYPSFWFLTVTSQRACQKKQRTAVFINFGDLNIHIYSLLVLISFPFSFSFAFPFSLLFFFLFLGLFWIFEQKKALYITLNFQFSFSSSKSYLIFFYLYLI